MNYHYSIERLPQALIKIAGELSNEESAKIKTEKDKGQFFIQTLQEIITKEGLQILTSPIYKVLAQSPFKFEITFTTLPHVTPPSLKEITLTPAEKVKVSDQDLKDVFFELQRQSARAFSVQRPAQKGDQVVIHYEGKDEQGIVYMTQDNESLILGVGTHLPEFEAALEGMGKGDKKEFKVTFPKDYFRKELMGKTLNFKVEVVEVQIVEFPELNDVFATQVLGKGKSMIDLKFHLKRKLRRHMKAQEKGGKEELIFDQIIQKTKIDELPEALIEQEVDGLMEKMYASLKAKGQTREAADKILQGKGRDARKQLRPQARDNVILKLALTEMYKFPELAVSEKEIEAVAKKRLEQASPEEKQTLEQDLKKDKAMIYEYIKRSLQMQKLFDYFKEK